MSAIPPLSGDRETSGERAENRTSDIEPTSEPVIANSHSLPGSNVPGYTHHAAVRHRSGVAGLLPRYR
jgi:hypothetical protein